MERVFRKGIYFRGWDVRPLDLRSRVAFGLDGTAMGSRESYCFGGDSGGFARLLNPRL